MTNKEIATSFLKLAALTSPEEAFFKYVAPHFKHHNQYFRGDRDSLLAAMKEADKDSPNKSFTIHQVIEEGNRVMTYSHVVKDNMEIAVVHMFRIEDSLIAEMWDVGQLIELDSPNTNGLF